MIGAGSVGAVVAGMAVLNDQIRAQLANAIAGDPAGISSEVAFRAQDFGHGLVRDIAAYGAANGPMVGFGIVAVVLAILMFRF